MTSLRRSVSVLALVLASAAPAAAQQQSAAGRIKVVSGSAFIVRGNDTIPARAGELVYAADGLRTGDGGSVGVTLRDDTRLSLGPNSEVRLDRFVYAPGNGGLGMVIKFVRGVAAYVSGRIARIAPESIRLETPSAIVGVRGTSLAVKVEER
jgi:hypothetical protein